MGRNKEPVSLIIAKGKTHLTKEEIEKRSKLEVIAGNDGITPPGHLSASQKKEFEKIAKELIKINIISNLDVEALASYIIAKDHYVRCNKLVKKIKPDIYNIDEFEQATKIQDRAYRQMLAASKELGLTIGSRCKLTLPSQKEEPKKNKFDKFNKSGAG